MTNVKKDKGIVFLKKNVKQIVSIHPETLQKYLSTLPKNEAGWCTFLLTDAPGYKHPINKVLTALVPEVGHYKNRQTKINGPTEFKSGID